MPGIVIFILGMLTGAFLGCMALALVAASRDNDAEQKNNYSNGYN